MRNIYIHTYVHSYLHTEINFKMYKAIYIQHLRRDDHRRQGIAAIEGTVRYGHQGGGQRQAGQGKVI